MLYLCLMDKVTRLQGYSFLCCCYLKYKDIQGHTYVRALSNGQGYKGFKVTRLQGYKVKRLQGYKVTRSQGYTFFVLL